MKKAIIVDDESMCIDLVERLIERCNIPVAVVGRAYTAREAELLIHAERPDIIYLDIELPDASGIDLMKKLHGTLDYSPQIIVITAYDSFEYAQSVLRLGASDILLKPVAIDNFVEAMERVVGFRYTENETFNAILEYIHETYTEEIDLDECASRYHLTKSHISRLFKQHLDTTFVQYRNRLRVEKAKELLEREDMPITQIAERVGFPNIHYFYRVFRKITGKTPKAFREHR